MMILFPRYKILFLDVLFPLDVKKIIFVDADQVLYIYQVHVSVICKHFLKVVRTDLKELLEVPLDGAPYGYTPFCDDRPEMDGFRYVMLLVTKVHLLYCRFWNSGYWKNHLGKRKYHISALYVIDLKQFRVIAAGDRLRGQYQMLSNDANRQAIMSFVEYFKRISLSLSLSPT